jgi:hypothetical protein
MQRTLILHLYNICLPLHACIAGATISDLLKAGLHDGIASRIRAVGSRKIGVCYEIRLHTLYNPLHAPRDAVVVDESELY